MIGNIDVPLTNSTLYSMDFVAKGWAYSEEGITSIKIIIDDREVGDAEYGLLRKDVKIAFPQYPEIGICGFIFSKNVSLSKGPHTLKVVISEKTGNNITLGTVAFMSEKKNILFSRLSSVFAHIFCIKSGILNSSDARKRISYRYLKGEGLEIGALHNPLSISEHARVRYVDRLPSEELQKHYSDLNIHQMVSIDIIDNGETLSTIFDNSLDFIIANHFLEHCENPIGTIRNHLRKIKPGGVIYYAIPEKMHTFDKERSLTDFNHLVNDDINGIVSSRKDHFHEWVNLVENKQDLNEIDARVSVLMAMNYSIHFHVWDVETIFQFLYKTKEYLKNPFTVLHFEQNENEVITLLQKK